MAYQRHFQLADDLVTHLDGVVTTIADPFLVSRYIGFVTVAATTVYELAVREIFVEFCRKKHKVFGTYASSYFERLNGRIRTRHLKQEHIPRFGEKYVSRYKRHEETAERNGLRERGKSIRSSYNNLILWRHEFAHEGKVPTTTTYAEAAAAYETGKEIIHVLARTMRL